MMTEMDDPMVLESVLAARAREKKEALSKTAVFENSLVHSPASGGMEVADQVVGRETSPPASTHSPVGDDMSKHGDGAQREDALEEDLSLSMEPDEGGRVIELPFESSTFSSPNSVTLNDNAGEGTAVAQTKRRHRGKNWAKKDTDDLLTAVLNTKKMCTRMEPGTASDPHWDAVAEGVPDRTGHECRGRMDTLKRSFSKIKEYCDEQLKEFTLLSVKDFAKMKVSPLTEEWYNRIRDDCPPRPKKKLKTNGAGSSSKSSGFVPDASTLDLLPPVLDEPALLASGPATLPMEDPPACVEFPMADQRRQPQAPPAAAQLCAHDSFRGLLASFEIWLNDDLAMQQ